jgi:pyridoxamine 5'-phosphate oxidase
MAVSDPQFPPAVTGLSEADIAADPLQQFRAWLDEAVAARLYEPLAMTLATATPDGRPAARMVLLRGLDHGFVFFTNYNSRKGCELAANPRAALTFYWAELHRQVRVEGVVEVVSAAESDDYFQSRPRGHRLAALASPQSQPIASRSVLEERLRELEQQYPGEAVPRPPHWGGYRVVPETIEFWQGRPNRVHDRLRYERQTDGRWRLVRLAP